MHGSKNHVLNHTIGLFYDCDCPWRLRAYTKLDFGEIGWNRRC